MTEIKGSYEKEGPVLVDTHGEYLESPRRVAGEMNGAALAAVFKIQ